jgi:chaperone required for assembly of F1-ATPase
MKRFYTEATVAAAEHGHAVLLDGRGIKTPKRAPLILPTLALADAVASEWAAQGDEIQPSDMPLTGLANAAIDIIASDMAAMQAMIGGYAETDALVYRGEDSALLAQQAALWNPLLDWAERQWSIQFVLTTGIIHVKQPPETVAALRGAVAAHNAWQLAALSPLATIGGSLVVALAVESGALNADKGWAAVTLEEMFQEERWGTDADAVKARALKEADWMAAALFAALLRG